MSMILMQELYDRNREKMHCSRALFFRQNISHERFGKIENWQFILTDERSQSQENL